ncbi:hypothetical protein ASF93_01900 [Microbacterium sp. Leaf347]|nr:hypothetical protein ASG00_05835 [Microbacterium sp. Leaf351]KQR96758.1 hypothetical protein ASF93_01900 [Microbacterium sp. Leaf347]OJU78700.1 MAG: hypothetical protein BGO15_14470 [Microbacterium sp. 71-23]
MSIYSDVRTAAEITSVLGLEPHDSHDIGEPTKAALRGMDLKPGAMSYQQAHWSLSADDALVDPEDETGFASLRVLVDSFRDRAEALAALRADCETIIWWSGDSDSSQGGFVIPADLLADLARLGCDLYGTAFLDDDDDDDA